MASAIRSIALPICGRAVFTAAATFASSALIMWAISNEDFRSRPDASAFVCLAPSWLNRDWLLRFFKSLSPEIALATQKDRKSTRLNSSHANISYAVFCLKKKKKVEDSEKNVEK